MKTNTLVSLLFAMLCNTIIAQNQAFPFIEVTGIGEVEVEPDIIYYSLTVGGISDDYYEPGYYGDDDPTKLKETIENMRSEQSLRLAQVWKVLESMGITKAQEQLDGAYNFSSNNPDYSGENIVLKLTNIAQAKNIADKFKNMKGVSGQLIHASLGDKKKYEEQATISAIADARQKAEKIAVALELKMGRAVQVEEAKAPSDDTFTGGRAASYVALAQYYNEYLQEGISPSSDNNKVSSNGKIKITKSWKVRFLIMM